MYFPIYSYPKLLPKISSQVTSLKQLFHCFRKTYLLKNCVCQFDENQRLKEENQRLNETVQCLNDVIAGNISDIYVQLQNVRTDLGEVRTDIVSIKLVGNMHS